MSNDTLHAWMTKYITGLKEGWDHEHLMGLCAIDQKTFDDARTGNAAFSNALALANAGVGALEINAPDLMRLLRAQCSDSRIAGYFGLSVDELREKIEASPELVRLYKTGRLKGQAELQMTQHVVALTGDVSMLTFLGKQHLDQHDKKTVELSSAKLDEMIAQLEAQLGKSAVTKELAKPTVDAEFEEVDSAPESDEKPADSD